MSERPIKVWSPLAQAILKTVFILIFLGFNALIFVFYLTEITGLEVVATVMACLEIGLCVFLLIWLMEENNRSRR